MKNRKALIRNSVFALLAVIVLLIAYNFPQGAKKAETTQSGSATETTEDVIDIPVAETAQEADEDAAPEADMQYTADNAEALPEENGQTYEEAPPAAEAFAEENTSPEPSSAPAEPASETPSAPEAIEPYCTLSVRCDTILSNMPSLKAGKAEFVPSNGVIYEEKTVKFNEGESVFNVLQREMKLSKIHMEFVNAPLYGSAYIEGIGNLYEFDCGELSGWMYKVNGVYPNYGCSQYKISAGDKIEWVYTCDLGKDVGGDGSARNGRKNETE